MGARFCTCSRTSTVSVDSSRTNSGTDPPRVIGGSEESTRRLRFSGRRLVQSVSLEDEWHWGLRYSFEWRRVIGIVDDECVLTFDVARDCAS